ncbi:MAG TPA: prepilin-type N-terminal cleavage/methylation domain-containing protein [Blastocatellia bacterium]|nr:prepilin-type N-terminal cleavage/methylation domain-containing protein [Blastocatellia bacterium]
MCRLEIYKRGGVAARNMETYRSNEAEPQRTAGGIAARGSGERGYTIIEVVVVLMVMAIAAAFVVPQVVNYMRMYRLGVAARNVATALQRARYIATSNNTRAEIAVRDSGMIDIIQYDTQGNTEPKDVGMVVLPEGIAVSPDAPRNIAFDGRGVLTPLPAQSPTIQINGSSPFYSVITVSPTGQVSVGPVQSGDS